MASVPKTRLTSEEYLAQERQAKFRSEFYLGETFAMAGASRSHNLIAGNIFATIHGQIASRDCEVYQGDMRVKVDASGLYVYPDVVVACEQPQFEDAKLDTLLNPRVLVEVLSMTTESYDRGTKWQHYQSLPALREYVLVSQSSALVEIFRRTADEQWLYSAYHEPSQPINLESIDCRLQLAQIYAKVSFEPDSQDQETEAAS